LLTISVGATYWGIQTQEKDALVINLAGRQRMLTQRMVWLGLSQPESPELVDTIQIFDQTMHALQEGGPARHTLAGADGSTADIQTVTLPPAPDAQLRAELEQVSQSWVEFRSHLKPADEAALQAEAPLILAQLDAVVRQYEERARNKITRVQIIQAVSFIAGLVLLGWGYLLTRRRIFHPLVELRSAARRMSQGDLAQRVPVPGNDELGELSQAFETMRSEVASAQNDLEKRVARRTRELEAAFEFSQEIVAQLDLEHMLQSVIDRARSLTNADAAALCMLEKAPSALKLVAKSGNGKDSIGLLQPLENDPSYRVVAAGETVVVGSDCTRCRFLRSHSPGTCAVAPLRAGDTTLGALCVVRHPSHPIDADETRALSLLANSATIAISNARLVETGRRQAEQAAILSERERLAAELHDNLAQVLGFMNLKIDQIRMHFNQGKVSESSEELEAVKSAISGAYAQVRAALVGLREPLPTGEDFADKIALNIEDICSVTNLNVALDISDSETITLPRLVQTQIIHILREALTNAHRHARVENVRVKIYSNREWINIIVEDDGIGFDPRSVAGSAHMGLQLMRARAERSGGSLIVESALGEGTRVEASFPKAAPRRTG
jgi:two-component system nitrate/nitrite sensor histidine kinase NarX